jgi:hypothetical protein
LNDHKGAQVTAAKRCLALLLVAVLALTMIDAGADAASRRRRTRRENKQEHQDKQRSGEDRSVDNLGVTVSFQDNEPLLPLGGGTLFDDDPDYFSGSISGFRNRCQGRILVEVFHANGKPVGSIEGSDNGSWSLQAEDPVKSGDGAEFFARASRFGTGKGARLTCAKGLSDTITIEDGDASPF